MVIQMHKYQQGQIRLDVDLSDSLPNANSVKQGCIMALAHFNMILMIWMMAWMSGTTCMAASSITCASRHVQAHTNIQDRLIKDLIFTKDAAIIANTKRALQHITSCLANASQLLGFQVILRKTEVLPNYVQPIRSPLWTLK